MKLHHSIFLEVFELDFHAEKWPLLHLSFHQQQWVPKICKKKGNYSNTHKELEQ